MLAVAEMLGQLGPQPAFENGLDQLRQEPTRPGQPQSVTLDLRQHRVHRLIVDQIRDRLPRGPLRGFLIEYRAGQGQPRPVSGDPFPHPPQLLGVHRQALTPRVDHRHSHHTCPVCADRLLPAITDIPLNPLHRSLYKPGLWSYPLPGLSAAAVQFRPASGDLSRDGGTPTRIPFGQNGDVPAIGRYENSAYDNLAIYRRSDASFYIRPANGGPTIRIPWGNPGDIPAPAYYEGGPHTNIAVYRPTTNTFYIRRANNTTLPVPFGDGLLGDYPAPGKLQ
ncbi:hypothetical protein O7626_38835 [Micromonospora sp. WMMD1102]|uniref:hypothetical protein n=1 Tax=Micromonospora sp. WMMD1102 TaxID=3016105 RepID=UPI0024151C21|nr:hypothetical protein [Micromonospora sp. WMMD1102]MDG4791776.1 hypothetical protein [Micromonospora sp. WMMD1102]